MKTIAIMASGPPKPNRNRHLEIFNDKPCITHVINNCQVGVKISVIISSKNIRLKKFLLENHKDVIVLETKDESMKTSYEVAFEQDKNDTLIVAGDLWNLKRDNILKFINSKFDCALYRLKHPWGKDIVSKVDKNLIRRGDVGDSVVLISQKYQKEFLSKENIKKAEYYFNQFYPDLKFNINIGNHLWTWLDYVFFNKISSSKDHSVNNIDNKGAIYINDKIYLDND